MKSRIKSKWNAIVNTLSRHEEGPDYQSAIKNLKIEIDPQTGLEFARAQNVYGKYCVPVKTAHRPAAKRIICGNVYEPKTIEFVKSSCRGGDIIHAGTYFGDFLPAFSEFCLPQSLVWAFEPCLDNFRCAELTIKENELTNINLFHAGLSSGRGIGTLVVANSSGEFLGGGSRLVTNEECLNRHVEKVGLVALDEVIPKERKISLMQLDVEGEEISCLQGAVSIILNHKPILILEKLPSVDFMSDQWFKKNILDIGYKLRGRVHSNLVFSVEEIHRVA